MEKYCPKCEKYLPDEKFGRFIGGGNHFKYCAECGINIYKGKRYIEICKDIIHKNVEIEKSNTKDPFIGWVLFNMAADMLRTILNFHHNTKIEKSVIPKWAAEIEKLSKEINDTQRISKALDWYRENIGKPFVPIIQSGKSFRQKFIYLEAAMKRGEQDNNKINYNYIKTLKEKDKTIKKKQEKIILLEKENKNLIHALNRIRNILKISNVY